jgi:uncharacterized protein YecT (DUF1311 family)
MMRTNLSLAQRSLIAALSVSCNHFATAGNRGVVDGPDECANVRAELNKTYDALLKKIPDAEAKEKLKQSQRASLAIRDAEAAFANDQTRGGSMAPTIRYETTTELTQQRIKQLKARLKD